MAWNNTMKAAIFPNPIFMYSGFTITGIPFPEYRNYSNALHVPVRRTDYEGDIFSIRRKGSAVHYRVFKMRWEKLKTADYNMLKKHFETYYAKRFPFFPPEVLISAEFATLTEVQKQNKAALCVYANDEFEGKMSGHDYWDIEIILHEMKVANEITGGN